MDDKDEDDDEDDDDDEEHDEDDDDEDSDNDDIFMQIPNTVYMSFMYFWEAYSQLIHMLFFSLQTLFHKKP